MATFTYDHIHLRSPNPEATAQYYERMFGAEVIRSIQQGKPRIDLRLGGANIFIAPVAAGEGVNPPPSTPYQGLDHFGLTVSGIDAGLWNRLTGLAPGQAIVSFPHMARPLLVSIDPTPAELRLVD